MKQENKRCGNCGNFSAYYTRGYCCLLKEDNGYCRRHEKIMEKGDGCDQWRCRRFSRALRTKIAVNAIPEIYHKLSVIEQILKEDKEVQTEREETGDAAR